jgi:hypothetical protein
VQPQLTAPASVQLAGQGPLARVTELWASQADLDASVAQIQGSDSVARAMSLVASWEMIELDLLGGKGPHPPA